MLLYLLGAMSGIERLDLYSNSTLFPAHDRTVKGDGVTSGAGKIADLNGVARGEGKVDQDKKSPVADIQHDTRIGLVIYR